jgi:serine/threonine-protein kinase RsbW
MIFGMTAPLDGPVSMRIPFAAQSAGRVRAALESWLDQRGSTSAVVENARLIATELVGNAVRHASPLDDDTVLVRWQEDGSALVISVCDGGGTSEAHQVDASPYDVSGRGLTIVDALSSGWWVEHTDRRHAVHVRLALD